MLFVYFSGLASSQTLRDKFSLKEQTFHSFLLSFFISFFLLFLPFILSFIFLTTNCHCIFLFLSFFLSSFFLSIFTFISSFTPKKIYFFLCFFFFFRATFFKLWVGFVMNMKLSTSCFQNPKNHFLTISMEVLHLVTVVSNSS